ncbi:alpha/beta hydrolase [Rodentibacter trehalosifermentans]|uniref:Alpha/beta hydrolase n=1 Tax=Rodentibacter trehalosifermentans TaxID=1908263 RepID=A0A1V3IYF5_9PAST|nr:alpha/beta fold hydrolase [Rodentibacter trehalosifermentans]OOF47421.1 alpha/beta hydrolase [Rodentibacter trehalosifermentans]
MKKFAKFSAIFTACLATQAFAGPLSIEQQGSFAVGGEVKTSEGTYQPLPDVAKGKESNNFMDVYSASLQAGGQTLHGDHATVFYQIPTNSRPYPLVFLHGAGQSRRTWQTTPDGREGFQNLFLRKNYPVYLVDQPRRGWSGRSTVDAEVKATPDDQFWFAQFRIGTYPNFNEGVAFPKDEASLNQFFRQMTPNVGAFDAKVISDSMVKLFERTGNSVLVTHSQGGIIGWLVGMQSDKVKAIVSFEPGNFPFPEDEVPPTITSKFGDIKPAVASKTDFEKLTKMPIIIYFGDFISEQVSNNQGEDQWRIRLSLAKQWAEVVNKHGGKVEIVELPKVGIKGNTHFMMQDTNNAEVAEHLAEWLREMGLDK